jgi:hypothetical protein
MTRARSLSRSSLAFSFVSPTRAPRRLLGAAHLLSAAALFLLSFTLFLSLPTSSPAQSSIIANAPVKNFRLPTFNDAGHRVALVRGGEARYISNTQIDILELNFAQFLGDGSTETDKLLLAPSATLFIKDKNHFVLSGQQTVRLIGENIEATGENWTFDSKGRHDQRLTMNKNVRVVFRAQLQNILD